MIESLGKQMQSQGNPIGGDVTSSKVTSGTKSTGNRKGMVRCSRFFANAHEREQQEANDAED